MQDKHLQVFIDVGKVKEMPSWLSVLEDKDAASSCDRTQSTRTVRTSILECIMLREIGDLVSGDKLIDMIV